MDDKELRLKCLELAIQDMTSPHGFTTIEYAYALYLFLNGEKDAKIMRKINGLDKE